MMLSDKLQIGGLTAAHLFRTMLFRAHTSSLYRWRYTGNVAPRLLLAPQDIRTADPIAASEIYAGIYSLGGVSAACEGHSPFTIRAPTPLWKEMLHGFGWLRHLRAAESELSRQHASAIIDEWIRLCGRYDPAIWSPIVVARRLVSWLSHAPLVLNEAPSDFYRRFMRSLSRQVRFLHRTAANSPDAQTRLLAAIALTMAGLSMANRDRLLRQASQWLVDELDEQILPDGGHISRNPQLIGELLLDLLPLSQTFVGRDMAPPEALTRTIDRMMPMLRFFRLGDGCITRFNGASTTGPEAIATLLAYDAIRGEPVRNARFSAYVRMSAGDTVVVADSGATPPRPASRLAHAGALSFEFSDGNKPVIVNCGAPLSLESDWRDACRTTAAHSTATLNDASSSRFVPHGWARRRLGPIIISGPHGREAEIEEADGACWVTMSHDGYVAPFGIEHRRRLALFDGGLLLQGEDVFSGIDGRDLADAALDQFAIRFHLHPAFTATPAEEVGTIIISPISGIGQYWFFRADGGADITVEESVFLAGLDGPRQCDAIVISGRCRLQPRISWQFLREDAVGSAPTNTPLAPAAGTGAADSGTDSNMSAPPPDAPTQTRTEKDEPTE